MRSTTIKLALPFLFALTLWVILSIEYIAWFVRGLNVHFDIFSGILAVAILLIWRNQNRIRPDFSSINKPAILLTVIAGIAVAGIQLFVPLRIFGFAASALALYGIVGMAVSYRTWKRGLVPMILLILLLPFGRHFDVFVGYPLRMLAADVCFQFLKPILPELSSVNTLLVIENKASHVNMDCSGVKGLWVSLIFYLTISWIEKVSMRQLGWWVIGALMLVGVVVGNFVRIILITTVVLYFDLPELDIWVHHSTSLFALLVSCGGAYFALKKWCKAAMVAEETSPKNSKGGQLLRWASVAVLAVCLGLVYFYNPNRVEPNGQVQVDPEASVASQLVNENWSPLKLNQSEQNFFEREQVEGLKFKRDGLQLMLILNGDWRSQHKPDMCYQMSGYTITHATTAQVDGDFYVHALHFEGTKDIAYYWFQNRENTTDDFTEKVWYQIFSPQKEWTLVSLISNSTQLPKHDLISLKNTINNAP